MIIRDQLQLHRENFQQKIYYKENYQKWHSNFLETGNITKHRKAPAPTVATHATALTVKTHYDNNQHDSVRHFDLQIIQKLSENDESVRKSFVEMVISRIRTNKNRLSFLPFSEEAHFHLYGRVNRHNFRYWLHK